MKNEGALAGVFSGMRNLSVRCVLPAGKLGPGCRLPTPGESCRRPCPRIRAAIGLHGGANGPSPSYRTRWEERALPIVRDEFRPAIPRRVARQQSPLPLHRHGQDKPLVASGQSKYHRTVDSVLTVCLTKRGNRRFRYSTETERILRDMASDALLVQREPDPGNPSRPRSRRLGHPRSENRWISMRRSAAFGYLLSLRGRVST